MPREFDPIHTKIAGVMSGVDAAMRQEFLIEIRESQAYDEPVYLQLVPEPDNPYDANAIRVYYDHPELGRAQLGYLKNSTTMCDLCGYFHERFPSAGCQRCGDKEHLRRDGVATRIANEMRDDPSAHFYAVLQEITGGGNGRSFGCNIKILKA